MPYLSVLVDENKRVRDISVSQVHHTQANPRPAIGLDNSQDAPHFHADRRAALHPARPGHDKQTNGYHPAARDTRLCDFPVVQ